MQGTLMKMMLLRAVAKQTGKPAEGLTREYVFGKGHAMHRSQGKVVGPQTKTTLQFLFDELEQGERLRLFPGQFDLGNLIAPKHPTKAALSKEIELDGLGNPEHVIRTIKHQIGELTGRDFEEYYQQDPGKTLKVTKLLYLLNTRSPVRMFSLLAPPDDDHKPSMSVTDSYSNPENMGAPSLLADLKAHLTLEIPVARRAEIDLVFGQLLDSLERIELNFVNRAHQLCGNDIDTLQRLLAIANDTLVKFRKTEVATASFMPLDEKLYLHCHSLEYLHFVAAQRFIYAELAPNIGIQPVGRQLFALSGQIQGKQRGSSNDECIAIANFGTIIRSHTGAMQQALSDGLGFDVQAKDIEKAAPLAVELLLIWGMYSHGVAAMARGFNVSPLMTLAALASVCNQFRNPTKYYPYWLGQPNARGNVISALKKMKPNSAKCAVPEEYLHYWKHQLQWFRYALAGQLSSYKERLMLGRHLQDAFETLVTRHDTKLLSQRLDEYSSLPAKITITPCHV